MSDPAKTPSEQSENSADLSAEDARLLIKSIEEVEKEEVEEEIRQRESKK